MGVRMWLVGLGLVLAVLVPVWINDFEATNSSIISAKSAATGLYILLATAGAAVRSTSKRARYWELGLHVITMATGVVASNALCATDWPSLEAADAS